MDPQNPQHQANHPHQPPSDARAKEKAQADSAANLIRQRLDSLYEEEPAAKAEAREAEQVTHRSKHQNFMHKLSESGKSLAEIQSAWHEYYAGLPDKEKYEVWDEFYKSNGQQSHFATAQAHQPQDSGAQVVETTPPETVSHHKPAKHHKHQPSHATRSVSDVKHQLMSDSRPHRKLKAKQHFQSLLFGLGLGSAVVLILLFGFFNERFIAPFITPSRHVSSTPIITDPNNDKVDPAPRVIIPKINVEAPVVYNEPSIDEQAVQKALERGVLHYATTPNPGERGNAVIFGHSSSNILNHGKAKFAFVLLSWLDKGDIFYLNKDGKRYVYKIYKKMIVNPQDVAVIGQQDKPDTATLITCDPPGTSVHRLVIVGQQISPNPASNTASTAIKSNALPAIIPSNSITLWQRIKDWFN